MNKFGKLIIYTIGTLAAIVVLSLSYFIYDANKNGSLAKASRKINRVSKSFPNPSNKSSFQKKKNLKSDISKYKHDFILNVLVKDMPLIVKEHKKCQSALRDELTHRNLNIDNIPIEPKKSLPIVHLIRRHHGFFSLRMNKVSWRLENYFYGRDRNKYLKEIGPTLFFESLNTLYQHSICYPEEYQEILIDIYDKGNIKKEIISKYFTFSYSIPSFHNTKEFILYTYGQMLNLNKEHGLKVEYQDLLSDLNKVEHIFHLGVDHTNYDDFTELINKLRKHRKWIKGNKKIARKRKKDSKKKKTDDRPAIKEAFENYKKLSKKEQQEIIEGLTTFLQSFSKSNDEIEKYMLDLRINSNQYTALKASLFVRNTLNIMKESFYQKIQINKGDREKDIIFKFVNMISNIENHIDREKLKKSPLSSDLTYREKLAFKKLLNELE